MSEQSLKGRMMRRTLLAFSTLACFVSPLAAQTPPAVPALAPSEIVAAAPASEWVAIDGSELLVMDLAPDARGRARRITIQLMPPPFSQGWVSNIRTLAAAHWWDGTSVNRVQDNYVVQWGDATEAKALPAGLKATPASDYVVATTGPMIEAQFRLSNAIGGRPSTELSDEVLAAYADSYLTTVGFQNGWAFAQRSQEGASWPVHCYGMVGVGRGLSPDTGSGAELYTVIGHAPRHLDRNIALAGRVIDGIEHLSSLPRGTEALGFYATAEERVPIVSVRLASELPAAEQPRFQYLSTESQTFARYADARANRRDPFFNVPAGGADICNIPVPVRRVPFP